MQVNERNWDLGELGTRVGRIALGIGVVGLAAAFGLGFAGGNPDRFYQAYLVSFLFFLSLGLGGLFFVVVNHLA
ncbi:MAG: hypothetical protein KC729_11145, partial [Candidatus Eisenbacteria bacterium]|nr:hypothetical protein [Candidatus Eisenbacteria bacterium]